MDDGSRTQTKEDEKAQLMKQDEKAQLSIFRHLMDSDLPPSEKTFDRLTQEGQILIGAGGDTVGAALAVITFHLLDNPPILARMRKELESVVFDSDGHCQLQQLESLPYLTAVINEGLRFTYGISHRAQRIASNETLRYRDWEIPKNTPVGMTSVLANHDESVFPDPWVFKPGRWIEAAEQGVSLEKYHLSFSRGTRICLGMQ